MRRRKASVPGWTDQRANGQNLDGTFLLVRDYNSTVVTLRLLGVRALSLEEGTAGAEAEPYHSAWSQRNGDL